MRAGRDRYRAGERLFWARGSSVAEVVVIKPTGQMPYPEWIEVERAGQRKFVTPDVLFRAPAPALAYAAGQADELAALRRTQDPSSEDYAAATTRFAAIRGSVARDNPYRHRPT